MQYCIYLRKSRSDAEAEEHGEGETLARHEKILLELAKKLKLNITEIYREIVSGETIVARPIIQRLLQEVENGLWNGVLVIEIERLARGDTIDQGIVAQTFKYSNTLIITPTKIYDPNNEFDEEYFEFGLFMSRREYKTINRRLQRGRIASVKEGKYVGNKAPYGYKRVKIIGDKGYTLSPIDDEAEIVRLIYQWYTTGEQQPDGSYKRLGTALISRRLNYMKIPTRNGGNWVVSTIGDILSNPVYTGKIRWNWRKQIKKMINGKVVISRPRSLLNECIITKGLHQPIISEEIFNIAKEFMMKNPPRPIGEKNIVKNPLAGIVICSICGRHMIRRPYTNNKKSTLMCPTVSCSNISSVLEIVENSVLKALEKWMGNYELQWNIKSKNIHNISQLDIKQKSLNKLIDEHNTLLKQLDKTHDLLEQGIYNTEIFLDRSRLLSEKIIQIKNDIESLKNDIDITLIRKKSTFEIIPKIKNLLEVYTKLPTAKEKNDMLKEVIEKIDYTKKINTRWKGSPEDFEILLYPKIPIDINETNI